jgi:diketogulonate reductase-like aldo/keto reductase
LEYRKLGKTSESVSVIGMGTWRIGSYRSPAEKSQQVNALRRGIELGINLIDTAEIYGDGRSELLVGEAIKGIRDSVFLATKVWPGHLRYDDVLSACDGSLQRLGTDCIDLYQIHWANPRVPVAETMKALEKLVRNGKVRHIGVSNFNIKQTNEAREALVRSDVVSNQVEYSITNRTVEKALLPYCEKEHITLIAYSPLARGIIPESRVPRHLMQKYNMTPAQAMLNWVTRHAQVVAIPKAGRADHVEENAKAIDTRLSQEEYAAFG